MHVIITGGAGFIGSNVTAAFLRDGHRVTTFDSLVRPGVERNLEWLEAQAAADTLRFVRGDVRDADLVRSVVSASDVHVVFHLAAQTAVTTSLVEPREDLEVNVIGTHNVLEAVRLSRALAPPILFYIPQIMCTTTLGRTACAPWSSGCRASTARASSEPKTRVGSHTSCWQWQVGGR